MNVEYGVRLGFRIRVSSCQKLNGDCCRTHLVTLVDLTHQMESVDYSCLDVSLGQVPKLFDAKGTLRLRLKDSDLLI